MQLNPLHIVLGSEGHSNKCPQRAGGVAQAVEHLPRKCKARSSNIIQLKKIETNKNERIKATEICPLTVLKAGSPKSRCWEEPVPSECSKKGKCLFFSSF
jgi:hypothetical protein